MAPHQKLTKTSLSRADDRNGVSEQIPQIYDELRQIAHRYWRKERLGHTLQPTALVHELYLKLANHKLSCYDRAHFLATCARMMRHILVDYARQRRRARRGGEHNRVEIDSGLSPADPCEIEVLALHDAIEKLSDLDQRQGKIVELRCFGGLTTAEMANVLGVSKRTVEGDWQHAKAWLRTALGGSSG